VGFGRFCSTAMREEKVRIFRALGPVRWSAAVAAMGLIMIFSSWADRVFTGDVSSRGW